MTNLALVIFAKNPEAGKVKTRLAATIGNDAALSVYRQLLQHTASAVSSLPTNKYVFYSDRVVRDDVWNDEQYSKKVQDGSDLGEKMKNAFAEVFREGHAKAVLIGTDCPDLTELIIREAFDKLDHVDVVIGPAVDGGYYLVGLKNNCPSIFESIAWSTSGVLSETINKCKSAGLEFALLQPLQDVDEEKDLLNSKLQWV